MPEHLTWCGRDRMPCRELHHLAFSHNPRAVRIPAHRPAVSELVLVLKGRLVIAVDGRRHDLSGGWITATPAGCTKEVLPLGSRGEFIWLGLGGGGGPALLDAAEAQAWAALPARLARQPGRLAESALAAARDLAACCAGTGPRLTAVAAAAAFIGHLLADTAAPNDDPMLAPALALVADDPVAAAGCRLEELARMCGLGRTAFCRRWSRLTGYSPADDIARRRLALAGPRLAAGHPVAVVAAALGYRSASAFAAAWRREHSRPPTAP